VSQKTSHLWFAITAEKVSNQNTLFTVPHEITCASVLPGKTGKHGNRILTQMLYCQNSLPEFIQSLLEFFNLFDSRLILTLLDNSINLIISVFSSGLLQALFKRKEVESAAAVELCCMHNACAPLCCLPERKNCHM